MSKETVIELLRTEMAELNASLAFHWHNDIERYTFADVVLCTDHLVNLVIEKLEAL